MELRSLARDPVHDKTEPLEQPMFERVCKAETIDEGGMRLVIANSQLIVLAWADGGQLKAFQGVCPHANTPLDEAEWDGTVLTCPKHRWTWNLNSGEPIHPQECGLAEYPVKVEDGVVYIDAEGVSPLFAPP
jgi:toluene monooxygenase system ferredoxin subunit